MNVAQALIGVLTGHDPQALMVLLKALPPDLLRADEGEPCLLETLIERHPIKSPLSFPLPTEEREAAYQPFVDVFTYAFNERATPTPALCERLLVQALDLPPDAVRMVDEVWRLTSPFITPQSPTTLDVLIKALHQQKKWPTIPERLMNGHVATDVSQRPTQSNPFNHIKTVAQFDALMQSGFNPGQMDGDYATAIRLLRTRKPETFANVTQRDAIVQRLAALPSDDPVHTRLRHALENSQKWSDLNVMLNAMGPRWMDYETIGGTALHSILHHRPDYLPDLIKRRDLLGNSNLWSILNKRGEPALMQLWFRVDTSGREKLLLDLENSPVGRAALASVPVLATHDAAFRLFLSSAHARCRAMPPLDEPSFWAFQERMGGWSSEQAKAALLNDPDLQQAFDKVVWNPHRSSLRSSKDWARLTTWIDKPGHPWVDQFRLLEAAQMLYGSHTKGGGHAKALATCQELLDQGVSWAWANEKITQGRWFVPSQQDWAALGARWEKQQLSNTLEVFPTVASVRSRPRL